jgi:hypothetical protein
LGYGPLKGIDKEYSTMSPGKIWITKCVRFLLLLIPAFALAMPAYAFRDPRLYDS